MFGLQETLSSMNGNNLFHQLTLDVPAGPLNRPQRKIANISCGTHDNRTDLRDWCFALGSGVPAVINDRHLFVSRRMGQIYGVGKKGCLEPACQGLMFSHSGLGYLSRKDRLKGRALQIVEI